MTKATQTDTYTDQDLIELCNAGHFDEVKRIAQSHEVDHERAFVHLILGYSHAATNDLNAAIASYETAVHIQPDYVDALNNLGLLMIDVGRPADAILKFHQALQYNQSEDILFANMAVALCAVEETDGLGEASGSLARLMQRSSLFRPADVSFAVAKIAKQSQVLQRYIRAIKSGVGLNLEEVLQDLGTEELLLNFMKICPIPDLEIEALLRQLRMQLLFSGIPNALSEVMFRTLEAIALQCDVNEYVYFETPEETAQLTELVATIGEVGSCSTWQLHICASYRSLHSLGWGAEIAVQHADCEVVKRHVLHFEHEQRLLQDIPFTGELENEVSQKVSAQYEENPYPRWISTYLQPNALTLPQVFSNLAIHVPYLNVLDGSALKVLIAGCGTGQQSISAAKKYANSQITAIDISRRSLGYAMRKTEEFGIDTITYRHTDILDLTNFEERFDVIECVGVLHHMENPELGWSVLRELLVENGLMRIGLYSHTARSAIHQAWDKIEGQRKNYSNTEIIKYRDDLARSETLHAKELFSFLDAYSTSELRDLIFNVHEHNFSIDEIQSILTRLNLEFRGFEIQKDIVKSDFINKKDDLESWKAFEAENPNTFSAMYQFWCQANS
ncbi:class I SAM-dependent methyltransferase [Epibacterium ulvae]|uniref:class I SAM-dependent methyltransferase n=1 Tax=Epibacterium ulvae TaxID=1156985 RepID=UPI002492013F|nr:class I SAM-dependent methyltransferase [Epibacterium ulvae]